MMDDRVPGQHVCFCRRSSHGQGRGRPCLYPRGQERELEYGLGHTDDIAERFFRLSSSGEASPYSSDTEPRTRSTRPTRSTSLLSEIPRRTAPVPDSLSGLSCWVREYNSDEQHFEIYILTIPQVSAPTWVVSPLVRPVTTAVGSALATVLTTISPAE